MKTIPKLWLVGTSADSLKIVTLTPQLKITLVVEASSNPGAPLKMTPSSRVDVAAKEIHSSEVGQEMPTVIEMQLAMAMKEAGKIPTMAVDEVAETTKMEVNHNARVEVNEVVIVVAGTNHKMKVEEATLAQLEDVVQLDEADIETTTAEMRLIRTMHTRQRTP